MTTTAIAPTNIAVLKYWGKNPAFDEYLIPTKSSLSFTVNDLYSKTTVEAKEGAGKVDFSLNGKKITQTMKEFGYIREFMEKAGKPYPFLKGYDYRIASENNFPTSAGYASSASGFAALVKAMAGELEEFASIKDDDKRLSSLARLGSGSATRSIPSKGGFVIWNRGPSFVGLKQDMTVSKKEEESVSDSSYAETILEPSHWPELSIIYAKVRSDEKKVKSRSGMKTSVETNPLYSPWVEYEEGVLKEEMISKVKGKDFPALGELIMKASNNMHQICLGSYPPLIYLNQTSIAIMDAVHKMNENGVRAAYTFDAGPNAVVFCLKDDEKDAVGMLASIIDKKNIVITKMGPGARYDNGHLF